ncbi:hypothetical protein [Bradyrhizobium sp. 930_D9_N1_4]|uniref:hypothetical protein n=1 Tax=Bradyrhizobium sp. 930_D9_N1_4 TaxID=3240374 RepID=UPI003F88E7CD
METAHEIISIWHQRKWRFGLVWWAAGLLTGLLFSFDHAVAQPSVSGVKAVAASETCPAADFTKFLPIFSASPDLQRRYTRLPFKFGVWGADEVYKTSMMYSFEKIPNYDSKNRTVLPTPLYMRKHGIKTEIITIKNSKAANDENVFPEEIVSDAAQVVVRAWVPDTGVNVLYLFKRMNGCWFLYFISDRST